MARGYNKNQGSRFSDGIVSEGHITLNGSLWIPDTTIDTGPNDEDPGSIYLGDDNDLKISTSDGRGLIQQGTASKDLIIQPQDGKSVSITQKGDTDVKIADFTQGAGIDLYHNNSKKFNTTTSGIQVLGADTSTVNATSNSGVVETGALKLNTGLNTNDSAVIKTTYQGSDLITMDFKITDNTQDYFRWRHTGGAGINSGNEWSEMELTLDGNGNSDLKVGGGFSGATGTVTADTFTGQAATVAALDNAAGTLTTDDLTQGSTNKYFSTGQVDTHISVTEGTASGGGTLSYSAGAFTFAPAQLASTTAAGIASFATADFSVSAAGAVSLNSLKNGDIASTAAISYAKLANVTANTIVGNNTGSDASAKFLTAANMITFLGIATGADNYDGWNINHKENADDSAAHTATKIGSAGNVKFVGAGGTKVTRNSGTVTITSSDENTEYSTDEDYGTTMSGTTIRLANDRRRNSNTDVKSGNKHDYTFYDHSHGIRWFVEEAEEMRLENDGDLHVNADIIAFSTTISDERLKENIQVVSGALDKVSQLKGVTFDWKKDGKKSAGLIAQDLEPVLPSAIKEKTLPFKSNDDEVYKTVEYSQVTALLVEAIKELKEQNTQLRADIEELKNINNR